MIPAMLAYSLIGMLAIVTAAFVRRTADKYDDVCVAVALPAFLLLLMPFGVLSGHLRPITLDVTLRSFDLALGLDGFALARILPAKVDWALGRVYEMLPLAIAAAWVVTRSKILLRACALGAALAFPLYLLVPACGPGYVFPHWPWSDAQAIQPAMIFPRNCFPSLHFAWALLLALNVRGSWRWTFGIYATLMAVATVAVGQHYFVDVAAGAPFALAVQVIACGKLHFLLAWRREPIVPEGERA